MAGSSYDVIIVGSGVSGSFIAMELAAAGMKCLMLEAGERFARDTYPTNERTANARLYWAGGIEFNHDATLGLLRAKAVGGGSIVNQALLDRFDDLALDDWRERTGLPIFTAEAMAPWYGRAESELALQTIPEKFWNRNARIFQEGFEKNGYRYAPLRRAQRDCHLERGNDCINCLAGCRLDSKQSMAVTTLPKALASGLTLLAGCEVERIDVGGGGVTVTGGAGTFRGERLVLAAGSFGNVKLLRWSGIAVPGLGENFFSHPQYMTFGLYETPVDSHRGPFQSLKSADPGFRRDGFKLENVFAPPVAVAMLLPQLGREHHRAMARMNHYACIEVAVRDTAPGTVSVDRKGKLVVRKAMNEEDRRRRDRGLAAVKRIFESTGARSLIAGATPFSLHLMGGCALGTVVDADFRLRGHPNVFVADSSVFPSAPGINPSLTVMALSLMGAASILKEAGHAQRA